MTIPPATPDEVGTRSVGFERGSAVEVCRATPEQWPAVKEIRLRALADSPRAFGSTLAREVAFEDQRWQGRVAGGTWFLAWSADSPVGLAALVTEEQASLEPQLQAMWVEPAQRGAGVAHALVEAVCDQARAEGAAALSVWASIAALSPSPSLSLSLSLRSRCRPRCCSPHATEHLPVAHWSYGCHDRAGSAGAPGDPC